MELTTLWFALIAILWIGYFVLEGFDFGVGMLLHVVGRDEPERRAMLRTIGPVWDGNEVWVLVAGGAMFAAFPEWYATLFSGFYLALFLILVALIVRGIGIEYRNKRGDAAWRSRMDVMVAVGSFVPAVLWGVAFANIVQGVPIDADKEFTGNLLTLLNPFGLLGGLTTLLLFLTHGLVFLTLKTDGDLRERARQDEPAGGPGDRAGRDRVPRLGQRRSGATRCRLWRRSSRCWRSWAPCSRSASGTRPGPSSAARPPSASRWRACSWPCSRT